jgi:hypothetical protein
MHTSKGEMMQTEIITNETIERNLVVFVKDGENVSILENKDGLIVIESPFNHARNVLLLNDFLSAYLEKEVESRFKRFFGMESTTQKEHRKFLLQTNNYDRYDHRIYHHRMLAFK